MSDSITRPRTVPAEGEIAAFDAGWHAQEIGIARDTVRVFTHPTGEGWALLGWDCRDGLERGERDDGA